MLKLVKILGFLSIASLMTGCIGIYNNTSVFSNGPSRGDTELEIIKRFGTPDFAGFVENQKVYTYRVRNNRYILVVGIYEGHDLIIVCENGVVESVSRVDRSSGFTLLNPVPWAETH